MVINNLLVDCCTELVCKPPVQRGGIKHYLKKLPGRCLAKYIDVFIGHQNAVKLAATLNALLHHFHVRAIAVEIQLKYSILGKPLQFHVTVHCFRFKYYLFKHDSDVLEVHE